MKRRALEICVLAYPRARRRRDREYLRDLALDLSEDNGCVRQAISLVRNGLVERIRDLGKRRAVGVVGAFAAAAVALSAGVIATTSGLDERAEVEEFRCAGGCEERSGFVAAKTREGWACTTHREFRVGERVVTSRCTLG